MPPGILEGLCRLADWPSPKSSPVPVAGGLMHRVYRVETGDRLYAVKVVNPTVAAYACVEESFRRCETIARSASEAGIPAVAACRSGGETIHRIEGRLVLVYPWLDGRTLTVAHPGPDAAHRIGGLVGRLHALDLGAAEPSRGSGPIDWARFETTLVERTWAEPILADLPRLGEWSRRAHEATARLGDWTTGHRDLDPKNVLWTSPTEPWLIDWESAGPIQAAKEAVGVALDWSGRGDDEEAFLAALHGYRSHRPLSKDALRLGLEAAFEWVGWLAFNLDRALGVVTDDPVEIDLGRREAVSTHALLSAYEGRVERLAEVAGMEWKPSTRYPSP